MHDPKAQLVEYLGRVAATYGEVPADGPGEFITVELVGESRTAYSASPSFAVQTWSTSDASAARLSLAVVEAMEGYAMEPHVRRCALNSRYEFPDPDSRKPRYQIVYDLVVQG